MIIAHAFESTSTCTRRSHLSFPPPGHFATLFFYGFDGIFYVSLAHVASSQELWGMRNEGLFANQQNDEKQINRKGTSDKDRLGRFRFFFCKGHSTLWCSHTIVNYPLCIIFQIAYMPRWCPCSCEKIRAHRHGLEGKRAKDDYVVCRCSLSDWCVFVDERLSTFLDGLNSAFFDHSSGLKMLLDSIYTSERRREKQKMWKRGIGERGTGESKSRDFA